eukprot:CAMPEP_0202708542 /NCGR_PEP_ID=MMETSP1385-20130828/20724_1 /ASSEMBLY_ACC=CAM_ASM_000861 /TAXON_ID=933848 /ORGANISM="Elphidium margaritaceum" /LENGTH=179 /DNA_ID=CAMNT_0049367543 /DNA_START=69 /DNA_END=608 /DNA_ORIENTATION=-
MRTLRTLNASKKALLRKAIPTPMSLQPLRHTSMPYLFAVRNLDVKVVSAAENTKNSETLASQRPISPAFGIYKFPLAGLASGAQRATGFALILGWTTAGLLSLPGLPVTVLPIFIEGIKSVPIIHATVKAGVAFSFGYHGTKNYFMPRADPLNIVNVHRAATYAILAGISLTGVAVFMI